jgi:hypothetical protein
MGSSQVNLLLDTHIWLWSHAEPDRLSKRVAGALADDLNQLWLSPISIWEFLLLTERGRVRVRSGTPPAEVEAALSRAAMRCAAHPRDGAAARPLLREGSDACEPLNLLRRSLSLASAISSVTFWRRAPRWNAPQRAAG